MNKIDPHNRPRHIAIIMDGNGRWAEKHALGRISGHRRGADAVRETVRSCRELGVEYLTLYAFSSENWQRPREEVSALMDLLSTYLDRELAEMMEKDIRLTTIGEIKRLHPALQQKLMEAQRLTAGNRSMTLIIALSYGSRDEILKAVRQIAREVKEGQLNPQDITREVFSSYLDTAAIPDPDLLIRTSGEYRLSNFLLWQLAYTEFCFIDVLWPDFTGDDLLGAIVDYQKRQRRFGLVGSQVCKD